MTKTRTRADKSAPSSGCRGATLLNERACILREAYARARGGKDAKGLHDLRVAARQWRAAVRLLDPCADSALDRLRRDLGRLTRELGDWRDTEVLAGLDGAGDAAGEVARAQVRRAVARRLARADWLGVMTRLRRIATRRRLSGSLHRPCLFDRQAARFLARAFDRLERRRKELAWNDGQAVHDFRRRVRLARYWAEFSVESLGPEVAWLARRMHALSSALGDVHDWDVYRQRHKLAHAGVSRVSVRAATRRSEALHRALRICERLWDSQRGRMVRKALRAARAGEAAA